MKHNSKKEMEEKKSIPGGDPAGHGEVLK